MPKVQKQVSRKVGDKIYPKYVVTIPPEVLEKYGIQAGDDVEITLKKIKDVDFTEEDKKKMSVHKPESRTKKGGKK